METISIMVPAISGRMTKVSVDVVHAHITEASLLALNPKGLKKLKPCVVTINGMSLVPLDGARRWLEAYADTFVATHLVPAVEAQSVSVRVEMELEKQRAAARAAEIEIIGQTLDGIDLFRKAASEAPAHLRIHPDMIDGAVKRGAFVGFRRIDDFWGEGEAVFNRLDFHLSSDAFHLESFKENRLHGQIITGPEMQAAHPDHALLRRRRITPYVAVKAVGNEGLGREVIVPEHDELFPWEYDLGKKPEGLP